VAALQEVGDAAGELDVLEPPCQLTGRIGPHLAVLARDQRAELGGVLLEQVPEAEEDVRAPGQRRVPPAREGLGGGRDGEVDLLRGGERDLRLLAPGGRVLHRCRAAGGAGRALAADPVLDPAHQTRYELWPRRR
jgi:hypothetical protein